MIKLTSLSNSYNTNDCSYNVNYLNFESFPINSPNGKASIYHNHDIINLQACSNWFLNLSYISNKNKRINSRNFLGVIEKKNIFSFSNEQNILPYELSSYLPIDVKEYQRFVLDNNHQKIPLLMTFDFNNTQNSQNNGFFTKITNNYSSNTFELELNGELNENNNKIFKENINFRVNGFDIIKSIRNKINEVTILIINSCKEDYFYFDTYVFNNVQCSFGINFSISRENLINYINFGGNYSFYDFNIRITKLYINYNLPIIVFSNLNNKINNFENDPKYINKLFPNSICNINIFFTNTTPFINESNQININNFLKSFSNFSKYGIECLFKIDFYNYIKISYFPILSRIYLNINNIKSPNKSTKDSSNNNSTVNYFSFFQNDEQFIDPQKIFIEENFNSKFPNYNEQINKVFETHPEFDIINLEDIGKDSYFSIIWFPNYQSKDNLPIISFEVFYLYKTGINDSHFLNILGVIERNGLELGNNFPNYNFDYFWFSDMNYRQGSYINNYYNNILGLYYSINKNNYLQLKNNIQKILNIEYSI